MLNNVLVQQWLTKWSSALRRAVNQSVPAPLAQELPMAQPLPLPSNPLQLRSILMPSANNEGCVVKNFEKSFILAGNKIKGLNFKEWPNPTARTGRWKEKSRNSCNRASPRSPTPYTRYEKGTSFPTDCVRLEDWKSRDKKMERQRSPRDAFSAKKPSPQMGFCTELCRGKVKPGSARHEEGFVDTSMGRGCLSTNINWI